MSNYNVMALSIQHGVNETERRFVWLQAAEFEGAYVKIAAFRDFERDGCFTDENSRVVKGTIAPVRREEPLVSCKVRVFGLDIGEEYIYTVGCDGAESEERYRFVIPASLDKEQSFFIISDLHINVYRRPLNQSDPDGTKALEKFEKTLCAASEFNGKPAFYLSIGDNISCLNMPASFFPEPEKFTKLLSAQYAFKEYLEFLSVPSVKSIPFATVLGNHDAVDLADGSATVGDGCNVFFDMPNDDGVSGHYFDGANGEIGSDTISSGDFSFVSGDVLVVGINAMVNSTVNRAHCGKEAHRRFIENAIESAPDVRWKILLCHVPAYSYVVGADVGENGKPTERFLMEKFFSELCDPYRFDLVFTGHQHAFSRTYPLLDGCVVGAESCEVVTHGNGTYTETLIRPRGVIHYNVPCAFGHSFFSSLPAEPEAYYPAYGVNKPAYDIGVQNATFNADKFKGYVYSPLPTYTHVHTEKTEDGVIMTICSVDTKNNEAFDTLIIKK